MVLLHHRRTCLAFLHCAALLERPAIVLDRKSLPRQLLSVCLGHRQIIRCPAIRFIEVGLDPENLDHRVTFQMNDPAFVADLDVFNIHIARPVWVDLTIGLQARQPTPVELLEAFETV